MTTGADHDPFLDDGLWGIPDGSSAGTGFGWGEGLAAESSLRELSTRHSSAAFSRSKAPSPPIENPSEPRFEAPLYDIFAGGARSLDLDGGARSLDVALDQSDHVLAYLHTQREGAQSTGSAADALPVRNRCTVLARATCSSSADASHAPRIHAHLGSFVIRDSSISTDDMSSSADGIRLFTYQNVMFRKT